MVSKIEVTRVIQWHKMDMCVRNINSNNSDTNLDAGAYLLESLGNTTAETVEVDKELIIKIKDVVYLLLRDAKDVTLDNGIDIEKSEEIVGLGNLIARNLASNYT